MQTSGSDAMREPQAPDAALTWQDRIYAWRDRMCASDRFQHWVATFPLTRSVAQRHARTAFDLCAGFVYSQILTACVQLGVLETLFKGPLTAAQLSEKTSVPLANMERLLAAAAALDLVSRRAGGRWGLGTVGAGLVGSPGVFEMVRHHAMLYADLRDPVSLLRGTAGDTRLAGYWSYATSAAPEALDVKKVRDYSQLMAASQAMIAKDVIEAYALSRHQRLLDVGGGSGAFVSAVAAAVPKLDLAMFDLPAVASLAEQSLTARNLIDRVKVYGGDFFKTPLPSGADVITLVRILHDHDDDAALMLLRNIRSALPDGGALLLAEPMSATPGGETMGDAYFGFYLLAMGSGRPRTPDSIRNMVLAAGFKKARMLRTARPMLVRAMVANT